MIIITACWKAKANQINDLKSVLEKMVGQVRENEADCLEYLLHQSQEDLSEFFFYEQYTSQEAVDFHKQTAHFKELMLKTVGMIEKEVEVKFYNLVM